MELTQTITCITRVSASLEEDGRLAIKVFAQADYAKGRSTTAEVADIPGPLREAAQKALQAILDEAAPRLGPRIGHAIHKSAEVAAAHGEI